MMSKSKLRKKTLSTLVVEDELGTIRGTLRALKRKGLEVENANSVSEAVEIINVQKFDLMIFDIRLPTNYGEKPEYDLGVRFIKTLQNGGCGQKNIKTPFFILTAQNRMINVEDVDILGTCLGVYAKLEHLKFVRRIEDILAEPDDVIRRPEEQGDTLKSFNKSSRQN